MQYANITEQIIAAAFKVHNTLGFGYLEKVYENALMIELRKRGLFAQQQMPVPVYYEDELVGDYNADILVENCIIVELKAVENLHPKHEVQLVNYLTAIRLDVGLLINFGDRVTIKRKYRVYRPKGSTDNDWTEE